MRNPSLAWMLGLLLSISLASSTARAWQHHGHQQLGQQPGPPQPPGVPDVVPVDPTMERIQKEQEKRMNKSRQDALKRDTDRLLKLATELKEHVDKTNENVLSLDVMHKAEEIEKLAKSVKDKMKGQ